MKTAVGLSTCLFASSLFLTACGMPLSFGAAPAAKPINSASQTQANTIWRSLPNPILQEMVPPAGVEIPDRTLPGSNTGIPDTQTEPEPTTPSSVKDNSVVEPTTLNGTIYDADDIPLKEAKIEVRAIEGEEFLSRMESATGSYVFNAVPAGVKLQITVEKPDYRTVTQTVVLKSNKPGQPDANRIDFGGSEASGQSFFLSNAPEIIRVSPDQQTVSDPASSYSFSLDFSKPVITQSVENNLQLYSTSAVKIGTATLWNPGEVVLDSRSFRCVWNQEQTSVTVYFDYVPLPSSGVLRYQLGFRQPFQAVGGVFANQDTSGTATGPFMFDKTLRSFADLRWNADTEKPVFAGAKRQGNQFILRISEPLQYDLGGRSVQVPDIDNINRYRLAIDRNQDRSFSETLTPTQINVQKDEIWVTFPALDSYQSLQARLNMDTTNITDLAGNLLADTGAISFTL